MGHRPVHGALVAALLGAQVGGWRSVVTKAGVKVGGWWSVASQVGATGVGHRAVLLSRLSLVLRASKRDPHVVSWFHKLFLAIFLGLQLPRPGTPSEDRR